MQNIAKSLSDVFEIIQPNCWMASANLKDAFFTIPIDNGYQKYFNKFMWYQKFYIQVFRHAKWYSDPMGIFTTLQKQGFISVIFVDDSYLQGKTRSECLESVHKTVSLLASLGFTVHKEKSALEPTQYIH